MSNSHYYKPSVDRDNMDLVRLALGRLPLTRCNGGRYVTRSNICDICGIDMEDMPDFCGQPVNEDGYTPFDATVARRTMSDHMDKFGEEL